MKRIIFFVGSCIVVSPLFAQGLTYSALVRKADSLYKAKDFERSGYAYASAFKINGWKGTLDDRYNAACSWALANHRDSAFFQLNRIATKANYTNYGHVTSDADLNSLHDDPRWQPLLAIIKQNKEKAEANLNKPLAAELGAVYTEDQKYRLQLGDIEQKYGWQSKEMKIHWKLINEKDSINLIKVTSILDHYGWLGAEEIGQEGNAALFLVIQHADLVTQEKYLPMMRDAVKKGTAAASSLALLEDRVALRQGRKQIYGSQIGRNVETHLYYVQPLDDPDRVDMRRASVGLPPLADYVAHWQIKWDVVQYKKDLPAIEAREKALRK